ncbi:MAG: recombinase zinc beta ribbon domain-containing protein, partial [Candidatus Omnitrophota bacterium]
EVIVAQGRHKPIVSQEDFDAVQRKLEQFRKGIVQRTNARDYPLTGVIICGKCGNRFQGCVAVSKRVNGRITEKRRYYRCCTGQTYGEKCGSSYVRANDVEAEAFRILELMFDSGVHEARLRNLIESSAGVQDADAQELLTKEKAKLKKNLTAQERLGKVYAEGLLAIEAFKNQILPLREDEKRLRTSVKRLELKCIQRERSDDYRKLLDAVANRAGFVREAGQKWMIRLIFKQIVIDKGRLRSFDLYEPFKSLYEGVKIQCQLEETERVATIGESVSTSALSAAR